MRRRGEKFILAKQHKRVILSIEVMECHGQPIKKNALRLVTAGRSFAVGSAASTVCHMRCSPLPPQQSKDQRPQDTSQNTDQERYDKVIEHHETPSLPCRIGLVGRGGFSITQRTTKRPLRRQRSGRFHMEFYARTKSPSGSMRQISSAAPACAAKRSTLRASLIS